MQNICESPAGEAADEPQACSAFIESIDRRADRPVVLNLVVALWNDSQGGKQKSPEYPNVSTDELWSE